MGLELLIALPIICLLACEGIREGGHKVKAHVDSDAGDCVADSGVYLDCILRSPRRPGLEIPRNVHLVADIVTFRDLSLARGVGWRRCRGDRRVWNW